MKITIDNSEAAMGHLFQIPQFQDGRKVCDTYRNTIIASLENSAGFQPVDTSTTLAVPVSHLSETYSITKLFFRVIKVHGEECTVKLIDISYN